MPYSKIVLTHSTTSGAEPNPLDLEIAELAVNLADGKLYTKDGLNKLVTLSDSNLASRVSTLEQNPGTWGSISGTLSDQTDLQNVLDAKSDIADFALSTSTIINGVGVDIDLSLSETETTSVSLQSDNLEVTQDNNVISLTHKNTVRNDSSVSESANFGNTVDIVTKVSSNSLGHITSIETTSLELPSLPNWEDRISALEYVTIDITSMSLSPNEIIYEYGDSSYSPLDISWSINKLPESLSISGPNGSTTLNVTDTSFQDTYSVNPTNGIGIPSTRTWTITTGDDQSTVFESRSINWVYPFFYGEDASILSSGTGIENLTKLVQSKSDKTVEINTNSEFIYYAYPSHYGDLSTILDGNGFNVTGSFTKYTSNVVHALSNTTVVYIIYKSNSVNTINQNFQFNF